MKFLFPIIVIIVSALALFFPASFLWPVPFIVPLLGIIMFGMGITLTPKDFKAVVKAPKIVLIGLAAQYLVMAGVAYLIVKILNLPAGVAIGVILVGTCPGGTASNVMTFYCKRRSSSVRINDSLFYHLCSNFNAATNAYPCRRNFPCELYWYVCFYYKNCNSSCYTWNAC